MEIQDWPRGVTDHKRKYQAESFARRCTKKIYPPWHIKRGNGTARTLCHCTRTMRSAKILANVYTLCIGFAPIDVGNMLASTT